MPSRTGVCIARSRGSLARLGIEGREPVPALTRRTGMLMARLVVASGAAMALAACGATGPATVKRSAATTSSRTVRFCHALVGALEGSGTEKPASTDVFAHQLDEARAAAATLVAASPNHTLATDARAYQAKVDAFYAEALEAGFSLTHPYPAGLLALGATLTFYRQAGPWAALHCVALPKGFGVHVSV